MELKDLILTPIYLILISLLVYVVKPYVTNKITKRYFVPALTLKLLGAIAIGIIYQFYYSNGVLGGDTSNYYLQAKIIYKAFEQSPTIGLKLLLANGEHDSTISLYTSSIMWYQAPAEYTVIKFAALFGIFSFNTYTVIGLWFACLSFSGMWAMYLTFLKIQPNLHKQFAVAVFFLPSVVFWGSGLLKDSLTIGALGWLFYGFYSFAVEKRAILSSLIISFLAAYIIYTVKVYILLSFLPPALYWMVMENSGKIKNRFIRIIAKPVFLILGLYVAYLGATRLTEGDRRYDVNKISERTQINSYYLSKQIASGSAYDIGVFDGSVKSIFIVGPQAIIVALFRPFIWEVRNPVMLLSALEATIFFYLSVYFMLKPGLFRTIKLISTTPILTFCLIFCLALAFGVGTNSGNFGTLVRYKIPIMPFFLSALYIIQGEIAKLKRKSVKQIQKVKFV
ncbi:hypothetical protein [Adhaeribacter pallidiroseus]|uniref:Glycosyltransferase RgtA/B/C/D-like domain-containing protein n=1 Tax=Adhaeribacter pallidiroseus TaxID=2072847 RepID=A0A369QGQ3_9BACT|nr:hypothetical protein [Adhaeribacter pallidiroseus]RDC64103.1 hypothetical protein AHMF7616_02713 [Adhaeribacter pallidiroseus]